MSEDERAKRTVADRSRTGDGKGDEPLRSAAEEAEDDPETLRAQPAGAPQEGGEGGPGSDDADGADTAAGEAPPPARRKQALRELLLRDSAADWLGVAAADRVQRAATERTARAAKTAAGKGGANQRRSRSGRLAPLADAAPREATDSGARAKAQDERDPPPAGRARPRRVEERSRLLDALVSTRRTRRRRPPTEHERDAAAVEEALVSAWSDTFARDARRRTERTPRPPGGTGEERGESSEGATAQRPPDRKTGAASEAATVAAAAATPPAEAPASAEPPAPARGVRAVGGVGPSLRPEPAAREEIPRAAPPSMHRPRPLLAPEASDPPSARLKIAVAGLAVGILYLGVSGHLERARLEERLEGLRRHDERVLSAEQTRAQRLLEERARRLQDLEERLRTGQARLRKLEAELAEARAQAEEAASHLEAARARAAELGKANAALQRERDALAARLSALARTREEQEAEAQRLRKTLAELGAAREDLQAQARSLRAELAQRGEELASLRREAADLSTRLRAAEAARDEALRERDQAQGSADELQTEWQRLSERLRSQAETVARLSGELDRARAALREARAAETARETERAALAERLARSAPRALPLGLVPSTGAPASLPVELAPGEQRSLALPPEAATLFAAARRGEALLVLRLRGSGRWRIGPAATDVAPATSALQPAPRGLALLDPAAFGSGTPRALLVAADEGTARLEGAELLVLSLPGR